MIAFGCAMEDPEAYRRFALPGLERAAEPGSEVYAIAAVGPIARGYNLLLDAAARHDDLEALVLVNQRLEITDADLAAKVRSALADDPVAVAGPIGATGVTSIAWWEGAVSSAPVTHRYTDFGGGEMEAYSFVPRTPAPAEVETLDGLLLALSPWAVRNLRFDEALTLGIGFDLDFCLQARAEGRRVCTADLRCTYHGPLELVSDHDMWIEAHMKVAAKWEGRDPGLPPREADWRHRARVAEAEREAARTVAYSTASRVDAEAIPRERELERLESTLSWRLTEPLRRLNERRR